MVDRVDYSISRFVQIIYEGSLLGEKREQGNEYHLLWQAARFDKIFAPRMVRMGSEWSAVFFFLPSSSLAGTIQFMSMYIVESGF